MPGDPERRRALVGYLVHDVSRLRAGYFDALFKQRGYNRVHWWTLGNIHTRGKSGISQGELARIMNVKKAMMGAMIDQLEQAGLVQRETDPVDRRVKKIMVTPKGEKLSQDLMEVVNEMAPRFNAGISDEDLDTTIRTLLRMRSNILAEEEG
jgi:DNA-binding MarR family transcriptional regulator